MKTFKITNQEELEKFKIDYGYHITGNLKVDCSLNIEKSLNIDGYLSIEAGESIEAGWYIKAGEFIKAGGSIKAGRYIEAGGSIKAGGYIKAGESIEAGGYIKAGRYIEAGGSIKAGGYIFSYTFSITCTFFTTKSLPFWRDYYTEMLPLKKWKKEILDESKCWNDYKKMITKKEAEEICKWDGWHWILRAQLEMFFGLKDRYVVKDER